ncbi:MAG: hypothetical protein M1834_001647 [Cirrosporium novae-zelandiae]|nr:MAG: hypothetical protein M1834_004164 [Cirrosporium novae-zelandiae]KAI9735631.1 MAG: hypothetical protein M1834_001647 [Cirrosporium novae-zelandiae]
METAHDKQWASKYLLDPLNEPEPSQHTGPGTHYYSTLPKSKNSPTSPSHPTSPARKRPSTHVRSASSVSRNGYLLPPGATSPDGQHSHRQDAFGSYKDEVPRRSSSAREPPDTHTPSTHRRRGSSLTERYPGDLSHRPLDMLKKENKAANRAPHLRKKHLIGPDPIDSLDLTGHSYHHEGPYDAAMFSRNTNKKYSPLEAVADTNREAIKATPQEKLYDSIKHHRPLDGIAITPPGVPDEFGRYYSYKEGPNLMIEDGGNYKRWPGVDYHPDDIKGKGEPSYTIEKALKEHKSHRRYLSEGGATMEMTPSSRPRSVSTNTHLSPYAADNDADLQRRSSTGRKISGTLKKRFGGFGGKKHSE